MVTCESDRVNEMSIIALYIEVAHEIMHIQDTIVSAQNSLDKYISGVGGREIHQK